MTSLKDPVPYSPDVEDLQPDERATAEKIAEQMISIIDRTDEVDGHAVRSVHAKSHAILKGRLTVHDGLPPELAQGIFATPRSYDVLIRISTIPGDVLRDSVSVPRGIAIKVFDVPGDRLPGAEGQTTQDFLMAGGPVFSAPDAETFLSNLKLLAATTERAEGAKAALSAVLRPVERAIEALGLKSPTLTTFGGYLPTNPLGEEYFSQVPSRYGDHIAKLSIVPESDSFKALSGQEVKLDDPNILRETVIDNLAAEGGSWTLRVQLCRDLDRQPVEDPSVLWDEADSPFVTVARLHVPAQTGWTEDAAELVDDHMRFSVWTGIQDHRPLGAINRARRRPYRMSADFRQRFNGCPIHEPIPTAEAGT